MARKKEDRKKITAQVNVNTPAKLKEIAKKLGYTYTGEGSIGILMDAIARGEIVLIQTSQKNS